MVANAGCERGWIRWVEPSTYVVTVGTRQGIFGRAEWQNELTAVLKERKETYGTSGYESVRMTFQVMFRNQLRGGGGPERIPTSFPSCRQGQPTDQPSAEQAHPGKPRQTQGNGRHKAELCMGTRPRMHQMH